MNKKEFSMLAMALRTYYPRESILPNTQAMELWYRELKDIPYEVAEAGLRLWVANNKWSPGISDIRAMANKAICNDIPDWSEAWELVLNAIAKYGSYEPSKAVESLPELARTAVKRIGYRNICFSQNITADRANFRDIYEVLAERKKNDRNIPMDLLNVINQFRIGEISKQGGFEADESKRISYAD